MNGANDSRKKTRLPVAAVKDLLGDAIGNFGRNGDANQAAAIALYAILSLIPLFILSILVISLFFGAYPEVQEELLAGLYAVQPFLSEELMNQMGVIEEKRQVLGWVGFLSLFWFASMVFGVIEKALDIIFRSSSGRNYFASKALAMAMIPLAWAVGIASVGLTSLATRLAEQPFFRTFIPAGIDLLQRFVFGYVVPFLIVVIFATLFYRVIPTRKIRWASAAVGGIVFAVLMEAAKHFFTWYVAHHTRYNVIFGSLEAVVILVIWVFYVALIFLFCAELIASYERRHLVLLEKVVLNKSPRAAGVDERLYTKFGRSYPRGARLFREGDAGREMFFILTGRVRVEKGRAQVKKTLAVVGPGEYIGEMAALTATPRTASAVTIEDSRIAVIDDRTFRDLLRESEHFSMLMLREFSRRIARTNEALDEMTQSWTRLAALVYFCEEWSPEGDRHPAEDIAGWTGKDAEDIQRVLMDLAEEGILALEGGKVTAFHRKAARDFFRRRNVP